jgi:gamma-glutamyltranspeptidase/glutathione hydrolase
VSFRYAAYPSRRSAVFARNVVATSHPLATQAGLAMLAQGGNALDAALAAAITLPLVEPTGNGLGSDAFCILWDGTTLHGLNASGRSPAAWLPQRFAHLGAMPERGWETVTVPGAVSAWVDLSSRFGRLPFARLFEPAIRHAEEGFLVSPIIGDLWQRGADLLRDQPGFAEMFMPGGRAPATGELFRAPAMARSLQQIAETKGEAFYRGALAEKIAAFARQHGAAMTVEDLAEHRNDWCGTIRQDFGDVTLHEIPPNGQGIAALIALGIARHLDLESLPVDSALCQHLQIEAMKLGFADAYEHVADGQHMEFACEHLLDDAYLAGRARLIDLKRAQRFECGTPQRGGTIYLTAADERGMMVSFIQSNFMGFGSGVVVPGTGISLQNRGIGFSLAAGHPNRIGPRKRPFHTIIPGFVMRGSKPLMAFGLMGGSMQAQGHVQMVIRTCLWGQDPQTAADAPRWRFVAGRQVAVEPGMGTAMIDALIARGHQVATEAPDATYAFGGAQLVRKIPGGYAAGSDPRKDGQAAGF